MPPIGNSLMNTERRLPKCRNSNLRNFGPRCLTGVLALPSNRHNWLALFQAIEANI